MIKNGNQQQQNITLTYLFQVLVQILIFLENPNARDCVLDFCEGHDCPLLVTVGRL